MTSKIDWNEPLEAYHPDGTVVAVELDNLFPLSDYRIKPLAAVNSWVEFNEDGTHVFGDVPWRIRNRKAPESKPSEGVTPELVERMAAWIKSLAPVDSIAKKLTAEYEAATKPVDPLVIEARKLAVEFGVEYVAARKIEAGEWDNHYTVQRSLAALKRGMELAQAQS